MNALPITQESEICQVLTCLPEKFIVDLTNGIDVGRDHLRVQKERNSFFNRCYDGITGSGARRQAEINANLIEGVEASLEWLTDLTESLAQSNLAIARVNDRVNNLKFEVAKLAIFSSQTRQEIENLSERLHERCSDIKAEIERIDFIQRAQINLSEVFSRWQAGRFESFSPAGRCFAAMEELRWGPFGDYCRLHTGWERQKFLEEAINRSVAQLKYDLRSEATERLNTLIWLNRPTGRAVIPDAQEALAYLGDDYHPQGSPFVFAATQVIDDLPIDVPLIMSATRLSEALVENVFER